MEGNAIGITNCKDFSATDCIVEHYHTGIHVMQDDPAVGISTHDFTGCRFKDIADIPVPQATALSYIPPRGAALAFTNYTADDSKLIHKGNTLSLSDFEDCHEGIMVNNASLDIEDVKMLNINIGIRVFRPANNKIEILDNEFDGCYLGVGVMGNTPNGDVNRNIINLKKIATLPTTSSPNYNQTFVPDFSTGIFYTGFNKATPSHLAVEYNKINITDNQQAIGIHYRSVDNYTRCYGNEIKMTSNVPLSLSSSTYPLPSLIGILGVNAHNLHFDYNKVQALGSNYAANQTSHRSAGFYLHKTTGGQFHCGEIDYTQYGMYMVGQNMTIDAGGIKNNRFANTKAGLLYRHLATEGRTGNIGEYYVDIWDPDKDVKLDCNNKFYNYNTNTNNIEEVLLPQTQGGLDHIFRLSGTCNAPLDKIFIDNNNSYWQNLSSTAFNINTSNSSGCHVQIEDRPYGSTEIYDCGVNGESPSVSNIADNGEVIDHAEDVASDDVVYAQFGEGGEEMDERELFHMLDQHPILRNSRPILNNFYLTHEQGSMAQLMEVDEMIASLNQTNVAKTSTYYINTLAAAVTLNNGIVGENDFENKEQWVNSIYLRMMGDNWTSFTTAEKSQLMTLAADCPYLGGYGVYKARTLVTQWAPLAHFDDLWICNTLGVYKNGNTNFAAENDLLNKGSEKTETIKQLSNAAYQIYPNPSNGNIHFEYKGTQAKEHINFVLYDLVGNVVFKKNNIVLHTSYRLPPMANGVYTYTLSSGTEILKQDKIIMER